MTAKDRPAGLRLPDFIVIGAAKSGTTTLQAWLRQQPEVFMCRKEPMFFAGNWRRGVEWYSDLFAAAPPGALLGEISPQYTLTGYSDEMAGRMAAVVPDAKLIYVLRDPIERLVSHYRYRSRRAKVRKPLLELVEEPGNFFVEGSRYHARLAPYIDAFPREQICVIRFEDLVGRDGAGGGWAQVLDHLGLDRRPAPTGARNVTANGNQVSTLVGRVSGARRSLGLPRPPTWVRRGNRWLARTTAREYEDPLGDEVPELPDRVMSLIWDDIARLEDWLGVSAELWPRPS